MIGSEISIDYFKLEVRGMDKKPDFRSDDGPLMDGMKKKVVKVIATHTVQKNETWTHLSLKYYGHTSEPYWRHIYEFNKELIGDNYKNFYEGLKIQIPELPDHLKEKE